MKNIGFKPTNILLPKNADMTKWSCVACDQYTSEPEYWNEVESFVGNDLSTLHIMLPEIYLSETKTRSEKINIKMQEYFNTGVFKEIKDSYIYVERTLANGKIRKGLVGAIDLEIYDFSKGTTSLCRPTEATVIERLPARVEIRKKAKIEMPHIMMLLDDKKFSVIEPYAKLVNELEKVYDFDLMQNSGHITGYKVTDENSKIATDALLKLIEASEDKHPMIYAMGDGNHSLAAAKQYYEYLKTTIGDEAKNHPSRFALVELVNLHDSALDFEPIHRIVSDIDVLHFIKELSNYCGYTTNKKTSQQFKLVYNGKVENCGFISPNTSLTIGTIQNFIDEYIEKYGGETDYIHGDDVVLKLAGDNKTVGFIVDGINKNSFFDVIKEDGILPRKTFSMGHACDKRFYLECREIN